MNKKALEGLRKEDEAKSDMDDIKKSIRHLEIELDYIENEEPHNYKYIRNLENKIDELYEKWDHLDENN
jgi:hypothetical protein